MVEVGMFRLPGLMIAKDEDEDAQPVSEETFSQIREWCVQHKCGKEINETKHVWMFKKEKERNFFLMRWG